jgi:hypothetical protein
MDALKLHLKDNDMTVEEIAQIENRILACNKLFC